MLIRLRNSPSIVQIIGLCVNHSNDLLLATEPLNGDLIAFLKTVPFEERLRHTHTLISDTLRGMTVLQKGNIQHFDIKPHNILIRMLPDGYRFIIADFGLARTSGVDLRIPEAIATVYYRPPELLLGRTRTTNEIPPYKIDSWSWGITICDYLNGGHFIGNEINEIMALKREVSIADQEAIVLKDIWTLIGLTPDQIKTATLSLRNGKATGHLPWEKRFTPELLTMIGNTLSNVETSLIYNALDLNTTTRKSPMELFSLISTENVPAPFDPIEPTRINVNKQFDITSYYQSLCQQTWCHPVAIIIMMEILTRLNEEIVPTAPVLYMLICYRLASAYIEPSSIEYSTLSKAFNVTIRALEKAEKEVLIWSQFYIYNSLLSKILPRVIGTLNHDQFKAKLIQTPISMYMEPVLTWFS
jgi:serine/threonine protein kinase